MINVEEWKEYLEMSDSAMKSKISKFVKMIKFLSKKEKYAGVEPSWYFDDDAYNSNKDNTDAITEAYSEIYNAVTDDDSTKKMIKEYNELVAKDKPKKTGVSKKSLAKLGVVSQRTKVQKLMLRWTNLGKELNEDIEAVNRLKKKKKDTYRTDEEKDILDDKIDELLKIINKRKKKFTRLKNQVSKQKQILKDVIKYRTDKGLQLEFKKVPKKVKEVIAKDKKVRDVLPRDNKALKKIMSGAKVYWYMIKNNNSILVAKGKNKKESEQMLKNKIKTKPDKYKNAIIWRLVIKLFDERRTKNKSVAGDVLIQIVNYSINDKLKIKETPQKYKHGSIWFTRDWLNTHGWDKSYITNILKSLIKNKVKLDSISPYTYGAYFSRHDREVLDKPIIDIDDKPNDKEILPKETDKKIIKEVNKKINENKKVRFKIRGIEEKIKKIEKNLEVCKKEKEKYIKQTNKLNKIKKDIIDIIDYDDIMQLGINTQKKILKNILNKQINYFENKNAINKLQKYTPEDLENNRKNKKILVYMVGVINSALPKVPKGTSKKVVDELIAAPKKVKEKTPKKAKEKTPKAPKEKKSKTSYKKILKKVQKKARKVELMARDLQLLSEDYYTHFRKNGCVNFSEDECKEMKKNDKIFKKTWAKMTKEPVISYDEINTFPDEMIREMLETPLEDNIQKGYNHLIEVQKKIKKLVNKNNGVDNILNTPKLKKKILLLLMDWLNPHIDNIMGFTEDLELVIEKWEAVGNDVDDLNIQNYSYYLSDMLDEDY